MEYNNVFPVYPLGPPRQQVATIDREVESWTLISGETTPTSNAPSETGTLTPRTINDEPPQFPTSQEPYMTPLMELRKALLIHPSNTIQTSQLTSAQETLNQAIELIKTLHAQHLEFKTSTLTTTSEIHSSLQKLQQQNGLSVELETVKKENTQLKTQLQDLKSEINNKLSWLAPIPGNSFDPISPPKDNKKVDTSSEMDPAEYAILLASKLAPIPENSFSPISPPKDEKKADPRPEIDPGEYAIPTYLAPIPRNSFTPVPITPPKPPQETLTKPVIDPAEYMIPIAESASFLKSLTPKTPKRTEIGVKQSEDANCLGGRAQLLEPGFCMNEECSGQRDVMAFCQADLVEKADWRERERKEFFQIEYEFSSMT